MITTVTLPHDRFDRDALRIVEQLQQRGYKAYFVGGCVRDLLMGRKPKDFDIATNARPQEIKRTIHQAYIIGARFRLVLARRGNKQFEIATFRKEPEALSHVHGVNENLYGSPQDDAFRRDFTLNALFYDPSKKELLDYVEGAKDIKRKVIRVIGDPEVRFQEDPIRMLRAIRFSARLGFKLAKETIDGIQKCATHLPLSIPDRRREDLIRLLREGCAAEAYETMKACGVLQALFPEWDYLSGVSFPPPMISVNQEASAKKQKGFLAQLFTGGPGKEARGDALMTSLLESLDTEHAHGPVPTPLAFTVFLLPCLRATLHATRGRWDSFSRSQISELRYFQEFHQSFRLSNQESHEICSLIALRLRLLTPPKPQEHKIRGSQLRLPIFPYLLKLARWEASAHRCKQSLKILSEWAEQYQLLVDSGFKSLQWLTPGPYDRKDDNRARQGGRHQFGGPRGQGRHRSFRGTRNEQHRTPSADRFDTTENAVREPLEPVRIVPRSEATAAPQQSRPSQPPHRGAPSKKKRRRRRRGGRKQSGEHGPTSPPTPSESDSE